MAKKQVDLLIYETLLIVVYCGVVVACNIALAASFQNDYSNNQGLLVMTDLLVLIFGIFRIRVFFNDVEE